MKQLKTLLGIACLLAMGFTAYCAVTGFGIIIALVLIIFPTWQIVLGTLLGSVGVFLCLFGRKTNDIPKE